VKKFLLPFPPHWQRKLVIEEDDYLRLCIIKRFQVLFQDFNLIHWFDAWLAEKDALESNCDRYVGALLLLAFTLLSIFRFETDAVEEDYRYTFAIDYVNQFKPSYYVLELLVLHLLQEDTEEIVIEVVLSDEERSPFINLFGRFPVAILRIFHQLSSNQCVLITVDFVFELIMYPHLISHISMKLISSKILSIMNFYLFCFL
jgi:hypothetical protein